MMKKIVIVHMMYFMCAAVFAQKNNAMGVEYGTKSTTTGKTNGIFITPTYWLEGDYSLQLQLATHHLIGLGVTKDGPLKDVEVGIGKENWAGYGELAKTSPLLGFSLLYQYKRYFMHDHETEGFYGASMLRFRRYQNEITEFDGKMLTPPLKDNFNWMNISYQIGYSKTLKSNITFDVYAGAGFRLEFVKAHEITTEYDWNTDSDYYVLRESTLIMNTRGFLNAGVRVGYAF